MKDLIEIPDSFTSSGINHSAGSEIIAILRCFRNFSENIFYDLTPVFVDMNSMCKNIVLVGQNRPELLLSFIAIY